MEKFVLRVLVLVLLGTSVGLAMLSRSKVMKELPPQPRLSGQHAATGTPAPSGAHASTGATGATAAGATGPTGVPLVAAPTGAPAGTSASGATGATGPTGAAAKPTGTISDYFIDLPQAKKMWDDKSAIFLDAREYVDYKEGHIAGAMSCPKSRFGGAAPKYVKDYLPGNAVVVYCHGAECTDSEAVVKRLIALNLSIGPFYILHDGYPAWQKAGYPINTGDSEGFN